MRDNNVSFGPTTPNHNSTPQRIHSPLIKKDIPTGQKLQININPSPVITENKSKSCSNTNSPNNNDRMVKVGQKSPTFTNSPQISMRQITVEKVPSFGKLQSPKLKKINFIKTYLLDQWIGLKFCQQFQDSKRRRNITVYVSISIRINP